MRAPGQRGHPVRQAGPDGSLRSWGSGSRRPLLRGRYFAEVFAGSGQVAKAAREWGFSTREWEISKDPRADVTKPAVKNIIKRDLRLGRIIGLFLGPPCQTFSISQNRTRGIRSVSEPWGKSNLSAFDAERVRRGNILFKSALELAREAHRCKVPWMLEHPSSAYSWHTDQIDRLSREPNVKLTKIDQCMYGAPWRKRTKLIYGNIDDLDDGRLQNMLCKGRKKCAKTGRPHQRLEGTNCRGVSWTSIASAYPSNLGKAMAFAVTAKARAAYLGI